MTAIEFENISKQYRLGLVSTGTLSHDLNRFWQTKVLRREDPYLKVGEVNDRAHKGDSEYVWALKDINFKVEQGDVVGIIGRNGAGKSTLLKLLSRVTAPTTGTIRARGRIASLLEVGTGFHPEMTGRENIYMNGAIMGMSRAEITRKLDEIVDFSGCERYLDTPVKRYSSGMTVRLGFAIAAHLEPEILVVDEVLAVGDAEFQKKAIGKMQDVSRGEGRTVLFVSHNMGAVKNLCKRGIVLNQGQVAFDGNVEEAVNYYLKSNTNNQNKECILLPKHHLLRDNFSREIEITKVSLSNDSSIIASDEPLELDLWLKNNSCNHKYCQYTVYIYDDLDNRVEAFYTSPQEIPKSKKEFKIHLSLSNHDLYKGFYKLRFITGLRDFSTAVTNFDATSDVLSFEVRYLNKKIKNEYSVNTEWFKTIYRQEPFIRTQLINIE
ncbi:polysaccharide ABC transporter ATP-binding protein [Fibrobacter sp. UWB7]|uniref:ABC transporter ATP-binding protein n=1 Tax=Fibrobacter sp. UWB7 TaxID=1896206 RepID=UPI00091D12CF|nr:polysaccharide ABC transporter ATP-binding protein [Fibrobacter sp. UWB7]SHM11666.1 ABC-type polysaccharide/polyol phosphate transport system, ATPase component [Fibrobacter sp. UWB7]